MTTLATSVVLTAALLCWMRAFLDLGGAGFPGIVIALGLAGWIFASKNGLITPANFTLFLSIYILSGVVLGGMGSIPGAIAGGFAIGAFVAGLRFSAVATRARRENYLVIRSDYEQPFGTFAGELPGAGELHEGWGVMERHDVRW